MTLETRDRLLARAGLLCNRLANAHATAYGASPSYLRSLTEASQALSQEAESFRRNPTTSTLLLRRLDQAEAALRAQPNAYADTLA